MSRLENFCKSEKCNKVEKEFINYIIDKYKKYPEKILTTKKTDLFENIIIKLGKNVVEDFLTDIKKQEMVELVYKLKKFILGNLDKIVDITFLSDETIKKIESVNRLQPNSLLEEKVFYKSWYYKKYGGKYTEIHKNLLKQVLKNQDYKTKLELNEKQKIMVKCCKESYKYSEKNKEYRPKSFTDPKFDTVYEYDNQLSDLNRSIWVNKENNCVGGSRNKKIVIIAYRGTGVSKKEGKFSVVGNAKRDLYLDYKIYYGTLTDSQQMKKIIEDFDNIYKNFGKEYKFYLTGHSLGGRLAFEIHRKRPKKVKECHIFNAGFGKDLKYLHDIVTSRKRKVEWEKNVYNYHIGGKDEGPEDDDYISVLSGGYGTSYTYYGKFNSYLKGHGLANF